ncbi:uncharacterized protein J4E78_009179 [Alternaria triticimaculans]|uniref:uncharacterized protein n=1 Tax=Alternaria triticimaculans TaxID=297637 RepID=UPI0020C566AA|nr:uncharacterized protein J4E78_009179 [Alternaria triticimaculans]KAI4646258.1 hypothetical protein J4E78_009179 [Alternaria triticimaculans]
MDRYTPELSMLRLKRRRDDDVLSSSRLPRAKKVAYTPTGIFDFMRLSAELRNQIYEYAVAEVPSQLLTPVHGPRDHGAAGIALTQVSRQVTYHVRSEYRPMWLARAKFVIDWHSVHAFLESFYPNEDDYGSGPKALIIQYETAFDCTLDRPTEIIHLVRLGLAFKGLEVRIIHFENCAFAGVSVTRLVQYGGLTRLETVQQDTALVKEAKRKWRVAVQEHEVKSVAITMRYPREAVDVQVKFSEQLASTTGTTGLDGLWDEIMV